MIRLYVSTDSNELKSLIGFGIEYSLRDYTIEESQKLISKAGFDPMSQIELPNDRNIGSLISKLLQNNLFVTVETEDDVSRYIPKDHDLKTELLQISQYENYPFSNCIFTYSINPYKIDETHGIPRKNKDNLMIPWILMY